MYNLIKQCKQKHHLCVLSASTTPMHVTLFSKGTLSTIKTIVDVHVYIWCMATGTIVDYWLLFFANTSNGCLVFHV